MVCLQCVQKKLRLIIPTAWFSTASNKIQLIHRHNLSSNIKISIKDENKDNNNTLYENNYTIPSIEVNNTIDIYKIKNNSFIKNDNIIINKNILIENNCIPKPIYSKKKKKIRYQTLFDILEQREKYKINNQSTDENINKENLTNAKTK